MPKFGLSKFACKANCDSLCVLKSTSNRYIYADSEFEHEGKQQALEKNPYFGDPNPKILFEIIVGMRLNRFERGEPIFWVRLERTMVQTI